MISVNYFLYDNRTWSPQCGRDWGVKAATGALANRPDLRADFDRYCGALPSEQGQLSGFGAAVGGVRHRGGNGYLLCVAVVNSDSFGRPSWAVYGLWCPDLPALDNVLGGDPISSARAILGSERPPASFVVHPAATPPQPLRRTTATRSIQRFDPNRSANEAMSMLLGAVRHRTRLPNILGVTSSSRFSTLSEKGFDVVYCHPMDERAERALVRAIQTAAPAAEQIVELPRQQPTPDKQSRLIREIRIPQSVVWSAGVSAALAAVMIGYVIVEAFGPGEFRKDTIVFTRPAPPPQPKLRAQSVLLEDLRGGFQELKELDPALLRESASYVKANKLAVRQEHASDQQKARDAFENLLSIREGMLDPNGLTYYFDEDGRNVEAGQKLKKIASILEKQPLGAEQCKTLRDDFGFEFDDDSSAVRQWCATLGKLDKTKRILQGK